MSWRLSRKADQDVLEIYRRGAEMFGFAQADAYHDRLERLFDLIAAEPGMARERREIDPPVRIHPLGAHVVVYRLEAGGDVLILRVRHGREDWSGNPVGE